MGHVITYWTWVYPLELEEVNNSLKLGDAFIDHLVQDRSILTANTLAILH